MALSRTWIPAGVSLCYGVYSSLLLCWLPLLGACVRRCGSCRPPEVSFGLRSFWCVRFFLALGCVLPVALSLTWIPAGISLCYGVYSSLLLCWLPLLGACSRRCGSCRPPEVSFGLRSFWCVRFFLALGCVLLFRFHLFAWCLLLVFSPRSGGVDLILCLARKLWHWHGVRYSLRPFPMVCFLHPWFCGVALFAGGPVPCLCSSCFHGLVLGMTFSAPRLSAAPAPALRLLPAS